MKDNIKNPAQLVFDITNDNDAEDTLLTIVKTKLKAGIVQGFNAHKLATKILIKKAVDNVFGNSDAVVRLNDSTLLPVSFSKVSGNVVHKDNIFKRILNWFKNLFK